MTQTVNKSETITQVVNAADFTAEALRDKEINQVVYNLLVNDCLGLSRKFKREIKDTLPSRLLALLGVMITDGQVTKKDAREFLAKIFGVEEEKRKIEELKAKYSNPPQL